MTLLRKTEHCVNGVQPVSSDLAIKIVTHNEKRVALIVLHYE
jgi:hypothetical protein